MQNKTLKEIKGNIPYTITIDEEGNFNFDYESTLENDIAGLGIAKFVVNTSIEAAEDSKRGERGKTAKMLSEGIDSMKRAYFGLDRLINHTINSYISFKNHEADEKKKNAKIEEIKNQALKEYNEAMAAKKEENSSAHIYEGEEKNGYIAGIDPIEGDNKLDTNSQNQ